MKALYSNIMRLILTIGLSERDLFVDKVSKIISEKMDADPQRSEHIAESLLRMAESLKTRGLLDPLPELRMSRKATAASNTGSTTLISPSTPAAMA